MNCTDRILVGHLGAVVWLRVEGKGSFQNSACLRQFAIEEMEAEAKHFVVDLQGCTAMDSTFMGTLTAISCRVAGIPDGEFEIINLNERTYDLLTGLGLDQVFKIDRDGEAWRAETEAVASLLSQPEKVEDSSVDKKTRAEIALEAHEALAEAHAENVPRFRNVIDCLKRDLQETSQ